MTTSVLPCHKHGQAARNLPEVSGSGVVIHNNERITFVLVTSTNVTVLQSYRCRIKNITAGIKKFEKKNHQLRCTITVLLRKQKFLNSLGTTQLRTQHVIIALRVCIRGYDPNKTSESEERALYC